MKRSLKITAALIAVITAMFCTSAAASADRLSNADGITYRVTDNGERIGKYTGWANGSKGGRYYIKDGIMLKNCWLRENGERTYFLRKSGRMAVGDVKINGKEYTFGTDGRVLPENFGIELSCNARKESVSLTLRTSEAQLKGLEYFLDRSAAPTIEKKTKNGWVKVGLPDSRNEILGSDDGRYYFDKFWYHGGDRLENGEYRVVKRVTVRCDKLVGGEKTYTFREEFEMTDDTEHTFFEPPELIVNVGGYVVHALKGTSDWGNEYIDTEEGVYQNTDSLGPLQSRAYLAPIRVGAGETVTLGFSSGAAPSKITLRCWDDKYWGDDSAEDKYTEIPLDGMSFTAEKGGRICEAYVVWGSYTEHDVTMSGDCYYTFYIVTE